MQRDDTNLQSHSAQSAPSSPGGRASASCSRSSPPPPDCLPPCLIRSSAVVYILRMRPAHSSSDEANSHARRLRWGSLDIVQAVIPASTLTALPRNTMQDMEKMTVSQHEEVVNK
eukprot:5532000-Prymnesium_polylepis.5